MKKFFLPFILALTLVGCEKNPIDRLTNPLNDGVVPGTSGVFVIYDDEPKTGGGVAFIPGGENQNIDFSDRSGPHDGKKDLRFIWNGGDVTNSTTTETEHLFAGFMLMAIDDVTKLDSSVGRDLRTPGYTKLTFWARGVLSENTTFRVEGPGYGTGGITPVRLDIPDVSNGIPPLSAEWTFYSLNIPSSNDFKNVKIFVIVSLQYSQPPRTTANGGGGVIYLDDIRYSQ